MAKTEPPPPPPPPAPPHKVCSDMTFEYFYDVVVCTSCSGTFGNVLVTSEDYKADTGENTFFIFSF